MAYQLVCPHCQYRVNSPFVRVGAMVRCASCNKKFRVQESHVMRSIAPQAKPEYVQAIHKEAESSALEGATSLSGLSDLMQREGAPPREPHTETPLPAAQRTPRPAATPSPASTPAAHASATAEPVSPSTPREPHEPRKGARLERLRRIRDRRATRVAIIAAVAGAVLTGAILAIVFTATSSRSPGTQHPTDEGRAVTAGEEATAAANRDTQAESDAAVGADARTTEQPTQTDPTESDPAEPDEGDTIADLMGISDEDPVGPLPEQGEHAPSPPPLPAGPTAARLLFTGGWQRIDPPRSPFEMRPEQRGSVRVTSTRQDFQPDEGIVVSVDFANRSSRTAAVVDFSAAALHADEPRVVARRRAAFALLEAGETHTVTMPLPARFTHDRLRVDAWVDATVPLADAWRALDPRIEEEPDANASDPAMRLAVTNGNVQTARSVLASIQGLDEEGSVVRDVLLHWTIDAEPMDRVTLNAVLPPIDADDPTPSQYSARAYLLPTPDPPPGVFTSPVPLEKPTSTTTGGSGP